jgi:hypothetical protein
MQGRETVRSRPEAVQKQHRIHLDHFKPVIQSDLETFQPQVIVKSFARLIEAPSRPI